MKKPTIIIPDELLAEFPIDQQDKLKKDTHELFAGNPSCEPVPELQAGATHCPLCGKELTVIRRNRKVPGRGPIDILACFPCDEDFVTPTSVQ